ncbi:MAG: baseplate J/gp47 family protein [Bacteroidia bacterium]
MNKISSTYKNPLRRDGTSQDQRLLDGLRADFVRVDEKEIQDWLLYTRQYAGLVQYYNTQNQPEGNWQTFIENDISTLVAMVSSTGAEAYRSRFETQVKAAEKSVNQPDDSAKAFAGILVSLFEIAQTLNLWYQKSIPGLSLHKTLDRQIQSRLEYAFAETLQWLIQGRSLGLPMKAAGLPDVNLDRLTRTWPNGDLPVEEKPFLWGIPETKRQIYRETAKLEGLFRRFYEVMAAMIHQAPEFLEETFAAYPEHQPHMALFLAFLNLMKIARDHMNSLTKRHLDFYFKEVLQLKNRPEDPDEVHLIFTLANNFNSHLIPENTTFDAGADDNGADRIYAANEEVVVNRAIIDPEVGLRTLFIRKNFDPPIEVSTNPGEAVAEFTIENIYAAPDADSSNGLGGVLPADFPTWELMGSENMPFAETGFAIASPMLLLGEGTRTIRMVFQFRNLAATVAKYGRSRIKSELGNNVKIYLSGEKDWVVVENRVVDILTDIPFLSESAGSEETLGEVIFELSLGVDVPAIVPYSEEIHQRGLEARFPVALFIFDNRGLSTLGDLDLNLRGGVAVYASDAEYLKGEFISFDNAIFKANADVIGIPPGDANAYLWSKINIDAPDPWQVRNRSTDAPYMPGDVVSYGPEKYRTNAKVWDLNPTIQVKIWESGPLGNIGFDPAKTYIAREYVSFENWLYQAKVLVPAIAPSLSPSWRKTPDYVANNTPLVKGEINFLPSASAYFVLLADEASGIEPGSAADILIWQQIKAYENAPAQLYKKDDVILVEGPKFYRARAGSKGIAPGSNSNGWGPMDGYVSGTSYQPNDTVVFKDKLYKATVANQGVSPEGISGVWAEAGLYSTVQSYFPGNVAVLNNKLYQATFASQNASPDQSGSSWIENAVWNPTTAYLANSFAVVNGNLYQASFRSKGVAPDGSTNSWSEVASWNAAPQAPYQVGDQVNYAGSLYKSKAVQSGIDPNSNANGWTLIPTYQTSATYSVGAYVSHNGVVYQAKFLMFFSVPPTGAANDPFWQSVLPVASMALYNPATLYDSGQFVQFDPGTGLLPYLSNARTQGVQPNEAGPLWELISVVNLYNDTTEYQTGNTVRIFQGIPASNRFFVATQNVIGDHPLNLSFPWQNISALVTEYSISLFYATSSLVKVTAGAGNVRFFRAIESSLGDHPTDTISVWADISSGVLTWTANVEYLKDAKIKVVTPQATRFFVALQSNKGADPTGATNPWVEDSNAVPDYSAALQYQVDDKVKVPVSGNPGFFKFFKSTGITLGSDPSVNSPIWVVEATSPVSWVSSGAYVHKTLVSEDNVFYQANIKTTGIRPSSGEKIWKKLAPSDYSSFNILPYDPKRSFINGDYSVYGGTIYQVNNSSGILPAELSPDLNPSWEKKSTLAEYDARQEYPVDTFVRFRGRIYRTQALTRGIPPNSDLLIWEKIDLATIGVYDPQEVYVMGDYVQSGASVFRANAGISGTPPPELEPEDEPWVQITTYQPGKGYDIGDHVWIGGAIYKSELPANQSKPGSGTGWTEITEILNYDSAVAYDAGAVVYDLGRYFVSLTQTTGHTPGQNFLLWEEVIRIAAFNGIERFLPGEYVQYGRNIYRALTTVVGDDPENSPELWQIIGAIPVYNNEKPYFQYSHVLSGGKVYMAMRNTKGLSPEADTAHAVWRQVLYSYPYKFFREPKVYKFDLGVTVAGIQNLILENDDGTIAPGKPFSPFGSAPKVGGNFYIGSHEVFSKAPSTVNIQLEWGDLPLTGDKLDFSTHYANYNDALFSQDSDNTGNTGNTATAVSPVDSNSYFKAGVNLLLNGNWRTFGEPNSPITLPSGPLALFSENAATPEDLDQLRNFHSQQVDIAVAFDRLNVKRDPLLAPFTAFRNGMARGFLQLRLLKDFFHADYPRFVAKSAMERKSQLLPNEPYTPLINRISLSYSASETINFFVKSSADFPNRVEQFFHIHPFGHVEFFPVDESPSDQVFASPLLVPVFEAKVLNPEDIIPPTADHQYIDATGNLFIGIRNLDLPQNLHILFQVAEGSEDPAHSGQRVAWSYLSHNRWKDLDNSRILGDTTNHLLTSGIVKFSLPDDMTNSNTLLPGGGLFWIRGSIINYADGIAKGLKILPQALLAGYRKQPENDPRHLATVLPSESITSLINRQAAISEVLQPFPSFGGRLAETDEQFYVRVSERLRHKNRGITIWDYERLVLEQFPQIYKVKCINHGKPGNELAAGYVHLVVIPDLRNQNAVNRQRPAVSVNLRNEIRNFLKTRVSDFTEVIVESPVYEEVRVKANVKFARGKDIGFYSGQIVKDIIRFMAPWLYDPETRISFTNEITPSGILNFLDEQQYVDYVTDFRLEYRKNTDDPWAKVTGDVVAASTASSLLVPAPALLHEIHPIEDEKCQITTSF